MGTTTPWVDATRSSHATTAVRAFGSLVRVADLEADAGAGSWSDTRHVLAAPGGEHVVVTGLGGALMFDRTGASTGALREQSNLVALTSESFFYEDEQVSWSGGTSRALYIPGGMIGAVWAVHFIGERVIIINHKPIVGNHESRRGPDIEIVGSAIVVDGPRIDFITKPGAGLTTLSRTAGLGAITREGKVAIVTTKGLLYVYLPHIGDLHRFPVAHHGRLSFVPYELSIVGGAIAAVESIGVPSVDLEYSGPYQYGGDLHRKFAKLGSKWRTRLHSVSLTGKEEFNVTVPFEVLQPPVDGGAGRVYLLGNGFAAVQDGHVLWSKPSSTMVLGTAFAGGELALASGPELRIVSRDGSIRQSFRTDGEPIAAPPAIASDGAVWVATNKALYVAR